jgi:hypothetical protein
MTPEFSDDLVVKLVEAGVGPGVGQRGLCGLGTQGLPGAGRRDNRTDEDHALTTWTSVPPRCHLCSRDRRAGGSGQPSEDSTQNDYELQMLANGATRLVLLFAPWRRRPGFIENFNAADKIIN